MTNKVLTIAGSDSGGAAGIQADLKTFSDLGVFGQTAITAVTAQNSKKISKSKIFILPASLVVWQIESVMAVNGAKTWKTGMLANSDIIKAVAKQVVKNKIKLVVDPIMVATSGTRLLAKEAVKTLKEKLIPLSLVITPNIYEAEILSGKKIGSLAEMRQAAHIIRRLGAKNAVVKGGHLSSGQAVDVLYDGKQFREFSAKRLKVTTHGTGCTFSAAIASFLALGKTVYQSVPLAKKYLYSLLLPYGRSGNGLI